MFGYPSDTNVFLFVASLHPKSYFKLLFGCTDRSDGRKYVFVRRPMFGSPYPFFCLFVCVFSCSLNVTYVCEFPIATQITFPWTRENSKTSIRSKVRTSDKRVVLFLSVICNCNYVLCLFFVDIRRLGSRGRVSLTYQNGEKIYQKM